MTTSCTWKWLASSFNLSIDANCANFVKRPVHLNYVNRIKQLPDSAAKLERAEAELWAEWYALGLADVGVFSDFYEGRVSALPMTAFAYNFKPTWYSGTTCQKSYIPDWYGFMSANDVQCKTSEETKQALDQSHLRWLDSHPGFPKSWVGNGQIFVT